MPWIWFVYMVCFFIQKKYDVHAYNHLSLKLEIIERLWALVKAPIFIEIKELVETCLSIVFWCTSVDFSL
jgi:hypothetical protein